METWILFVLLFGLFKGIREPIKKKALTQTDVLSTLFMYTFLGFLMTVPTAGNVLDISLRGLLLSALKAAMLFVGWMASLTSLKKLPVSFYGVVDLSRMFFSTAMGVIFLRESLTLRGIVSLVLICCGVYMAGNRKSAAKEGCSVRDVCVALTSSLFSAASGVLDKYIMTTEKITSAQLQFWFMGILSVMYLVYMFLKKQKPDIRGCLKNPWIWLMSLFLVFGDRLLFIANADPDSKVTVMTLVKQCSVLVTIAAGKILYKEKYILRKLFCAGIILAGIVLAVL
ncbi:MAG: EamA family transporter [Clostridia bacterium]|nr:EamA family transporter [Clostridia bacterium]